MKISSQVGLDNVSAEGWEAIAILSRGVQDRDSQTGLCSSSSYLVWSHSAVTSHDDYQLYGFNT